MKGESYKRYLLAVLSTILAFNYVDRAALGLVLQNIKVDLSVSDTQLGFLTGLAFAAFYSVVGVPIARWADRGNRVTIIALSVLLWGIGVCVSGAAKTFEQLLLIRVAVAVGEAGCIPPAISLIADYFSRPERPRAVGLYMLGVPFSCVIGYYVAGVTNELYGWRVTFVVLGAPGLVLALLGKLTLREPRLARKSAARQVVSEASGGEESRAPAGDEHYRLGKVCRVLWKNTTFRHLLAYFSIASFFGYGIAQWVPAFFVRSYGLGSRSLGTWFSIIYGVGGILGTYLGGAFATRRAPNNEGLQLKSLARVVALFALITASTFVSPNAGLALLLLGVGAVGASCTSGPIFGTIQTLIHSNMRAMSMSLIYLFANLVGLGLGPLMVGLLSDLLRPLAGDESLRYALLALSPGYLWAAWHLRMASLSVERDLRVTQTSAHFECDPQRV